jgi:hypothetical protein
MTGYADASADRTFARKMVGYVLRHRVGKDWRV